MMLLIAKKFIQRMGELSADTKTTNYAWALMTNHAHVLLRSSEIGLSGFMRRLLTGYAISYNRRHRRWGHLFQNRYKSIVCDEDAYFPKLVRYIHLNPLRRKSVSAVRALISIGLVKTYGVALAEVARRLGVSTSAISKIISRSNQ